MATVWEIGEISLRVPERCDPHRSGPQVIEPHREALVGAADPETAFSDKLRASPQEGGLHQAPANPTQSMGLSLACQLMSNSRSVKPRGDLCGIRLCVNVIPPNQAKSSGEILVATIGG